jgi:leucyl aminopeptidase
MPFSFATGLNFKNQGGFMKRFVLLFGIIAQTNTVNAGNPKILADLSFLQAMGISVLESHKDLNLAVAEVSDYQLKALPHFAHRFKKCGGFELIDSNVNADHIFSSIHNINRLNLNYESIAVRLQQIPINSSIQSAIQQINIDNLKATVQWMASINSRFHQSEIGKKAVMDFSQKLEQLILETGRNYVRLDLVGHKNTSQKSVRVHVEGRTRPQEIVVIGGHFDSINNLGSNFKAPGADDNASGSANVLEVLRVLLNQNQPERSVEFFWYAGEEGGLLGSAEIAAQYKSEGRQIIGAMQLDMTAYAGSGEGVIGEMTDYTSAWLRDYLRELNNLYVGAKWIQDKCGYGCSDHASWYRNGFPAVIPFEASMDTMNKNLHTPKDIVSPVYNFKHSSLFAKLGLAFVMDLSNSEIKQPY